MLIVISSYPQVPRRGEEAGRLQRQMAAELPGDRPRGVRHQNQVSEGGGHNLGGMVLPLTHPAADTGVTTPNLLLPNYISPEQKHLQVKIIVKSEFNGPATADYVMAWYQLGQKYLLSNTQKYFPQLNIIN